MTDMIPFDEAMDRLREKSALSEAAAQRARKAGRAVADLPD